MRNRRFLVAVAMAALYLPANATHAADEVDPLEKANRVGFAIHEFFDRTLIRPAALTYAKVVPVFLRDGVRNILDNMGEPRTAANDVLQLRFEKAATAAVRFAANSTVGLLGFFDVAKHVGLQRHVNGFDLTLGRAGVKPGPYLFIPLLGPSTFRDAIGNGVNVLLDPLNGPIIRETSTIVISRGVVGGLDTRARADSELTSALGDATDPYATMRSLYLQNQQGKIDDNAKAGPPLPDFDDDMTPPAAAPAPKPSPKTSEQGAGISPLSSIAPSATGSDVQAAPVQVASINDAPNIVGLALKPATPDGYGVAMRYHFAVDD